MAVKPLKDLLKEADVLSQSLGLNKTASSQAAPADDISKLAQELMQAEGINNEGSSFEKTAMALNRAEALLQIQTFQKIAAFRAQAKKAGYSEEQIEEAVEKVAAKKLKDNLAVLTAVEGVVDPGKDKNSLEKKKVPAHDVGQASKTKDLTSSLGYGR